MGRLLFFQVCVTTVGHVRQIKCGEYTCSCLFYVFCVIVI